MVSMHSMNPSQQWILPGVLAAVATSARIVSDGVPKGIRTPVAAVKGQCPRPLDDGDVLAN